MARRANAWQETETLRERLYQRDLDTWGDWLRQQDRLRSLLPKALDLLEEQLDAGGPEAVRLALALVRMTGTAAAAEKPQPVLLQFVEASELRARLRAHGGDDDVPALRSGE